MKRLKWLFIIFTASTISSYAQTDQYRLDQYVNPDYKRQALDFEVESSGNFRKGKSEQNDETRDESLSKISGSLVSSFNKTQNSLSKQREISSRIGFSGFSLNQEYQFGPSDKEKRFSTSLSHYDISRYYLKEKQFIEFSPQLYGSFNREKLNGETESDTKILFTQLSFRLGYGKGRIEHVEDARHAIYILEALKKNAVLKRNISDDDITRLAECMTVIKHKRQFDSRIKLIEEIATVDSFLVANNIVEETNGSPYFTALYDEWQYAGLITRLSGSRFSAGVSPDYYFLKQTYGEDKSYNSRIQGTAYVNYNYEKPVNLYWQHSFFAEVGESVGRERYSDDNFWNTYLELSAKLGYYPNSRTYMTVGISEDISYLTRKNYDKIYSRTYLAFDAYYYLSPQLRLKANANIAYLYNKNEYDRDYYNKYIYKEPVFAFEVALTYSIF